MERIIAKPIYPLLPEGVMFLTEKQKLAKQEEEAKRIKKQFETRINSLKKKSYPDGTLFGIALLKDWNHTEYDYQFLDCASFEEAKEKLYEKIVIYNDYDHVIAYIRKPVVIMKEMIL